MGTVVAAEGATVEVRLGFMPSAHAIDDPDHPGLLRAGPRGSGPYGGESVEYHQCLATDGCHDDSVTADLLVLGFDTVDLSPFDDLQAACARVVAAGCITDDDASIIRAALTGATLRCSSGASVRVAHIADEGFIMRKAGPNALSLVAPRSTGMNDHGVATSVHGDQDVYGTPLKQLMDGRAPSLLRHDSPDGHNHDADLMLVNLWIPLRQITQPLAIGVPVPRPHLDGLATTTFLERDDDMAINDIWTFLHDPGQRWHLRSDMDHRAAYVFNTLSAPHGSCTLPGEEVAERAYRALEVAEAAVVAGDRPALLDAVALAPGVEVPDAAPPALRAAIAEMRSVAESARYAAEAVCGERAAEWSTASQAARGRVVRMSLELRLVVSLAA